VGNHEVFSNRVVEAILPSSISVPNEDAFPCRLVNLLSCLFWNLRIGYTTLYPKMLVDGFPAIPKLVQCKTCLNGACRKPIADIYSRHQCLSPVLLRHTNCMYKRRHSSNHGTVRSFTHAIGLRHTWCRSLDLYSFWL